MIVSLVAVLMLETKMVNKLECCQGPVVLPSCWMYKEIVHVRKKRVLSTRVARQLLAWLSSS